MIRIQFRNPTARPRIFGGTPERHRGQPDELPLGSDVADTAHRGDGARDVELEEVIGDAPVSNLSGHTSLRNGACTKVPRLP